ncbi:TPA: hypothetical protein N0F65_012531 [Lagenidium giganteum]|uniref:Uncharacterized protein n=1 Tax=Lagenidium giganteum TaxID=4803 RepID=A0AAV2YNJ1_9STRA|nr:TPA: hypothetical protein N0F65_012531 [Lagenidium giganteum]
MPIRLQHSSRSSQKQL